MMELYVNMGEGQGERALSMRVVFLYSSLVTKYRGGIQVVYKGPFINDVNNRGGGGAPKDDLI